MQKEVDSINKEATKKLDFAEININGANKDVHEAEKELTQVINNFIIN